MAGHSQFSNIKHRKESQDSKRAKKFTKLRREIIVATRAGLPDPELNPRLKSAIIIARREGLPKDKIDNAIKSAAGNNKDEDYQEVRYEGYGPCGAAIILNTLTNNRNRTAAKIRFLFSKNGGNLAELGSVDYLFEHVGVVSYHNDNQEIFDFAIENNAYDVEELNNQYNIICKIQEFSNLRGLLYDKFGEENSANLIWKPKDMLQLTEEEKEKVLKLIGVLEDNEDVQSVYHNI